MLFTVLFRSFCSLGWRTFSLCFGWTTSTTTMISYESSNYLSTVNVVYSKRDKFNRSINKLILSHCIAWHRCTAHSGKIPSKKCLIKQDLSHWKSVGHKITLHFVPILPSLSNSCSHTLFGETDFRSMDFVRSSEFYCRKIVGMTGQSCAGQRGFHWKIKMINYLWHTSQRLETKLLHLTFVSLATHKIASDTMSYTQLRRLTQKKWYTLGFPNWERNDEY